MSDEYFGFGSAAALTAASRLATAASFCASAVLKEVETLGAGGGATGLCADSRLDGGASAFPLLRLPVDRDAVVRVPPEIVPAVTTPFETVAPVMVAVEIDALEIAALESVAPVTWVIFACAPDIAVLRDVDRTVLFFKVASLNCAAVKFTPLRVKPTPDATGIATPEDKEVARAYAMVPPATCPVTAPFCAAPETGVGLFGEGTTPTETCPELA